MYVHVWWIVVAYGSATAIVVCVCGVWWRLCAAVPDGNTLLLIDSQVEKHCDTATHLVHLHVKSGAGKKCTSFAFSASVSAMFGAP